MFKGAGVTISPSVSHGHVTLTPVIIFFSGGDVNAQAPNGDSVLYDAAGSGNPDCINLLLQNGANPNIASLSAQLPIHRAAYEGHYL